MEIMHRHLSGSLKGFVALAKQKNPGTVSCTETPSFQHQYYLSSKRCRMRRSKWLATSRVGHYSRGGCVQRCALPWKLLTHTEELVSQIPANTQCTTLLYVGLHIFVTNGKLAKYSVGHEKLARLISLGLKLNFLPPK
jgi:hypothetical protein